MSSLPAHEKLQTQLMKINEMLKKALWDGVYNHVKIADLHCNQINQKLKTPFAASTSGL